MGFVNLFIIIDKSTLKELEKDKKEKGVVSFE